jgi:heme peroxidase
VGARFVGSQESVRLWRQSTLSPDLHATCHRSRCSPAPKLNLEIIYSDGPVGSPYLFDVGDPAKFLLGPDGGDVPRNRQGVALIGDPRDDVHRFSLSLHVALLRAHNRIVDLLRADGVPEADVFARARVTLTWHYQWVAVHDFLPRLVGTDLAAGSSPRCWSGCCAPTPPATCTWNRTGGPPCPPPGPASA